MRTSKLRIASLCAIMFAPAAAMAQVNGYKANTYVFNDYPASTVTITNPGGNPVNANIRDENMVNQSGNGANRHDLVASTDGGTTAATFPISNPFTISANLTLTAGTNSPRKEAGLRVNSGITGDFLFIVNSDAGEIVAFGGPFYNFRSAPFNEPAYLPGETILMGMTYTPGAPGTLEYFIDRGAGIRSSGPLNITNLEGGPLDYQLAAYGQGGSANNPADFFNVNLGNLNTVIPEPASLALMSLGGLAFLARRRGA